MNSDFFNLEIYKDEDMLQKIAVIDNGVFVSADDLSEGVITGIEIWPLVTQVQTTSQLNIEFVITSPMYKVGKVEITMPPGLIMPADGTVITVTPIAGSTRAISATVSGHVVIVENLV